MAPGRSIVKRIGRESGFASLGQQLNGVGYDSVFVYGGRGYFINEKYLRQQLNVSLKPARKKSSSAQTMHRTGRHACKAVRRSCGPSSSRVTGVSTVTGLSTLGRCIGI